LQQVRREVPHQVLDDDLGHARGRLPALERLLGEFSDADVAVLDRVAGRPHWRLGGLGRHGGCLARWLDRLARLPDRRPLVGTRRGGRDWGR